jgi:hypothetical protein
VHRRIFNKDGSLKRYKARFVAKGYSQIPGIDFHESFAPVCQLTTLLLFLNLLLYHGLDHAHWDVETAYLYADLPQTIFCEPPEGKQQFDEQGKPMVWQLNKSLYGLKQAGREWHHLITAHLLEFGFEQSVKDSCLFQYKKDGQHVIIVLYVDDVYIAYSDQSFASTLFDFLNTRVTINNLGPISHGLGHEFEFADGKLHISQKRYILDLLDDYNMSECVPTSTPIAPGFEIHNDDAPDDMSTMGHIPYTALIGSLLWISRCSRPDIAFAVSMLARWNSKFSMRHWKALKGVLRYLKHTIDYKLTYITPSSITLTMYTDADHAGDKITRQSTSGCMVFLGSNALAWFSRRQHLTVALSTVEAEYYALSDESLGYNVPPCETWCDNQGTIAFTKNRLLHNKSKHIDTRRAKARLAYERGIIIPAHIPSGQNIADIFTKSLASPILQRLLPLVFECLRT